jgi:hypothetical protein
MGQNPLSYYTEPKHNILAFGRQGQQTAAHHVITLSLKASLN